MDFEGASTLDGHIITRTEPKTENGTKLVSRNNLNISGVKVT